MFRLPCLLAGLFGLCALPSSAREAPLPVQLSLPAPGAKLVPGEMARIEWAAEAGSFAPLMTEWEAFLSIDGGRSYPIRLTPHLDLAFRGFSFQVPNVPSLNARLLLRFGDERTERIFEPPTRFEIGAVPARRWSIELLEQTPAGSWELGEAARDGEDEVVLWTEGDREGRGLRSRVRLPARTVLSAVRAGRRPLLFAVGPESGRLHLAPPNPVAIERPFVEDAPFPADDPRSQLPLRLRIHRFNE